MNTVGDRIRKARAEKHLTQQQIADALDVTNKAVSKWETGEALPETAQLVPLCDLLGLTVDELLQDLPSAQTSHSSDEQPRREWLDYRKWYALNKSCRPADWAKRLCKRLLPALAILVAFAATFFPLYFTGHGFAAVACGYVLIAAFAWFVTYALVLHFNGYLPFDERWKKRLLARSVRIAAICALLILSPTQACIWLVGEPWITEWAILPLLLGLPAAVGLDILAIMVAVVDIICWLGDKMKYREAYFNGAFDPSARTAERVLSEGGK